MRKEFEMCVMTSADTHITWSEEGVLYFLLVMLFYPRR